MQVLGVVHRCVIVVCVRKKISRVCSSGFIMQVLGVVHRCVIVVCVRKKISRVLFQRLYNAGLGCSTLD